MAENSSAAVLGTGIMGAAMARNLSKSGFEIRVWNRSKERAEPLAKDGAKVADSPTEAADGADFLITMLPDAEVTSEIVGDGALDSLADGAVWIQTGTVGVEGNEKLSKLAADENIAFVDAPVLGTKQPAENGELIVLASGPDEAKDKVSPIFEAIGKKTMWVGEAGSGSRLKLVTNNWILGLLATLGETVAFSKELGVDPNQFLEAIGGGPLDLPYAQMKAPMMIKSEYPTSFPAKHARKDAGLVMDASDKLPMKVSEAVAAYFDAAIEAGHSDDDMAAIYEGVKAGRG
ncbi:MAG: NAD(P)-dependent oxidoreductase [Rubrobacteraceae bacterium]